MYIITFIELGDNDTDQLSQIAKSLRMTEIKHQSESYWLII